VPAKKKMSDKDRGLELKVGIFVAIGLLIVGALVVEFGRFGEGLKTYYPITVHFPDASGLLKSSDVLLGGAKIGRVAGPPRLVSGGRGVDVPLKIYHFVNIPVKSTFTIGSSGLLGDRFVSIYPPAGKPSAYIAHGARVEGARAKGISDLTKESDALIKELRGTLAKVDAAVTKLNDQALSKENMDHLHQTFDNLSKTTAALSESSKKLDGVIEKADATMGSAKEAAENVNAAAGDARKTAQSAGKVMKEALSGSGVVGMLLTNEAVANDLRALIYNLRHHGVLFYRDSARTASPEASPPPRRRR
jgi:phospholipid/cholesterol/gamma-HCH transport system substrate-binding protein